MKRALFTSFLLLSLAAFATTIRPMTVEQMTASATHVIEGQAVDKWVAWDSQHREILTYTRFNVLKTLKGSVGKQVLVAQLGGTLDGLTLRVAGIRHFDVGETTLLFLRPGDTPAAMSLDTMQGNFRVQKDATGDMVASNGLPDMSVLHGSQITTYTGNTVSLGVLETRIRQAATNKAVTK
jgi:hypothetical protein